MIAVGMALRKASTWSVQMVSRMFGTPKEVRAAAVRHSQDSFVTIQNHRVEDIQMKISMVLFLILMTSVTKAEGVTDLKGALERYKGATPMMAKISLQGVSE